MRWILSLPVVVIIMLNLLTPISYAQRSRDNNTSNARCARVTDRISKLATQFAARRSYQMSWYSLIRENTKQLISSVQDSPNIDTSEINATVDSLNTKMTEMNTNLVELNSSLIKLQSFKDCDEKASEFVGVRDKARGELKNIHQKNREIITHIRQILRPQVQTLVSQIKTST